MHHSEHKILNSTINSIDTKFSALSNPCKSEMIKLSKLHTVDKSEILVKEGQKAGKLYFIINGCIKVFYNKDGRNVTDWFAFENEFVCSINSFFLDIPSPHYIQTLERTTFLELSKEDVFMLTEKHHCFETLSRKVVTLIMLKLQKRIVSLQFESAKQKYEYLINERKDILQRASLSDIASFLGITLETLSRIRNSKSRI